MSQKIAVLSVEMKTEEMGTYMATQDIKPLIDKWLTNGIDPRLVFQVLLAATGSFGAGLVLCGAVPQEQVIEMFAEEAVYASGSREYENAKPD